MDHLCYLSHVIVMLLFLFIAALCSDSFTILGLLILGLAVSHINESNCKLITSKILFFMTSLQYHCILGLSEMKTLHPRDKIMCKRYRIRM